MSRNRILAVLFFGVLMAALDIAIIGPALPSIQQTFGVDERALTWVFSIYVLMNLVGTPLMAKLSDIYGRRTIYVMDVALFGLGSAIVLLSPSFGVLLPGPRHPGLWRRRHLPGGQRPSSATPSRRKSAAARWA